MVPDLITSSGLLDPAQLSEPTVPSQASSSPRRPSLSDLARTSLGRALAGDAVTFESGATVDAGVHYIPPTVMPTATPTSQPTAIPTVIPTAIPTVTPTAGPGFVYAFVTIPGGTLSDGLAVDTPGNVYSAGGNRVYMIAVGPVSPQSLLVLMQWVSSGDGGLATAAALNGPHGVAVDTAGNVYFADTGNRVIRKVTASTGYISTVAGTGSRGYTGDGGAATSATFNIANGVAVDIAGNIYIADLGNSAIRKVTASTGIITAVAGGNGFGFSGDGGLATLAMTGLPVGVAVDTTGNLYIADSYNGRIRKVRASTGIISTVAGGIELANTGDGGLATLAGMNGPQAVAVDKAGNLYILDGGNYALRKVTTSTGIITTTIGNGVRATSDVPDGIAAGPTVHIGSIFAIAVNTKGDVYFSELLSNMIVKVIRYT